jgi:hypothetical protein
VDGGWLRAAGAERQFVAAAREARSGAALNFTVREHGKAGAMIKKVGPTTILGTHRATCHCGAVVLELSLPDGIVDPCRCNCSICRRKGAIVASVPLTGLRVVKGAEILRLYQFNSMTAKHYFCSRCGIYTHHVRRSNPNEYGYNVGCLDGVDPFDLGQVPIHDGVHHPADRRAP